jgi:hypothetical protein
MLFPAPHAPAFSQDQASVTQGPLRYEDCIQDGRMLPTSLPAQMSGLWQSVIARHPGSRNAIAQGVVPVLTRLTLHAESHPIRIDRPVEARSGFQLAHDLDDAGAVSRLFMNVWTEVHGMAGRVGPRQVDGEQVCAGRLFAEHTFTRLFAAPDQRKVTQLAVEGYPQVPPTRHHAPAPKTAQEAPEGASWLDELAVDPLEVPFTLDHTDANQHVNSLIYVRLFLDATHRRLAIAGQPLTLRSHAIDIAYRKPSFAGDRVRSVLRLFRAGASIGAAGHIEGTDARVRCYVRVLLGP